jgi:membrane-associated phospholipid phosphatase
VLVVALALLLGPASLAQQSGSAALPAESVIAILRSNPDLIGPMKAVAIRLLQTQGVAVGGMTDEGLFTEIRSDERVRQEISDQLRAQGYVPAAKIEPSAPLPPPPAPRKTNANAQGKVEASHAPAPLPQQQKTAARSSLPPAPSKVAGAASPAKAGNRSHFPKNNRQWADSSISRYPASDHPSLFLRNFVQDQKDIWTSPAHVQLHDLNWILPFAGLTGGMLSSDAEVSSRITNPSLISNSGTFSNVGVGVLLAGSGGLYLMGKWGANPHQKETGILAMEAAGNSFLVSESFKVMTQRQRPLEGTGQGNFFTASPFSSGFPSQHAVVAWSVASVIAHEYPGVLTQIFVYGLAAGVSVSRVTSKNHFPSDVLVGSVAGWLIGRQIYRAHHDPELPGAGFGTSESPFGDNHPARNLASSYVPLDSWIYPAFDRLSALGVIPSGFMGMRPWTRMECARMLGEATGMTNSDEDYPDEASRLYAVLQKEFAPELEHPERRYLQLDSVYFRGTGISGQPLTDGYHFGQTIVNDFGRPYQQGFNAVAGFSGSSSFGPMGFYVRGEFEHAPSAPGYSQAVQDAIQVADGKPLIPASPIPAFNQFRLLDAYAMFNFKGWQASFGRESLWLGPTQDPFAASDNAVPVIMFRFEQTMPRKLPSVLGKLLGPYRTEFWFGRLEGQHFVDTQSGAPIVVSLPGELARQPFVNGFKVSFKPTRYFEFGVGRTGLFGGPDFPVTLGTFKNSMFSTGNSGVAGQDPGDRRSFFDFSYAIPGLRRWLILYNDSFVEDEISPIGYPRRAAQNQGLYMPQLPFLHKMDLRVEGGYTNLPGLIQPPQGGFFYWNVRYLDGYTNNGNILGDATLGRQGIAFRAQSTYWVAADKTIQVGYRNQQVDSMFLQGGSLRDVYVHSEWTLNKQVSLTSFLQYEWWNFPLLSNGNQRSDFTASFQLTYRPHWKLSSEHQ